MINQSSNPQFEWNQNDICLLYVIYFSLSSRGECCWLCYESRRLFSILFCSSVFFSLIGVCSQDDLVADLIAGGRATGKMFSSLSPSAYHRRALVFPQNIWSHVSAWAGSKGIRACGLKCLHVSGGTPLHFQASAPPSIKWCSDFHIWAHTLTQSCAPQWPLSLLVWSWENYLSLRAVTFN